jgi:hypothetical protein
VPVRPYRRWRSARKPRGPAAEPRLAPRRRATLLTGRQTHAAATKRCSFRHEPWPMPAAHVGQMASKQHAGPPSLLTPICQRSVSASAHTVSPRRTSCATRALRRRLERIKAQGAAQFSLRNRTMQRSSGKVCASARSWRQCRSPKRDIAAKRYDYARSGVREGGTA